MVDVVIVGGGIAGSTLATVLSRAGLSVTVLERQRSFADRVRGEYMALWGVQIAERLGVLEALAGAGGAVATYAVQYDELIPPEIAEQHRVEVSAFVPGVSGVLCVPHPIACETLAQLAPSAGADVVRGVDNIHIEAGARPRVQYTLDGSQITLDARLIVGADGRNSTVRQQAGIELQSAELTNLIAGLLIGNAPGWPQDTFALGVEGDRMYILFPEGGDRVRLYLAISPEQRDRFAGPDGAARFLETYRLKSLPRSDHLANAKPIGPCATLGGEDTWTDEPFTDGVVLVGDAGGYNGPIIGQGLSLAMRDVELVSSLMLGAQDWSPSTFAPYAADRTERMRRVRFMADLHATLFCSFTQEAVQRRGAFLGRMGSGAEPTLEWVAAAPLIGPYNLPPQAFDESYRELVLGAKAVPA